MNGRHGVPVAMLASES